MVNKQVKLSSIILAFIGFTSLAANINVTELNGSLPLTLSGKIEQGGYIVGHTEAKAQVKLDDTVLPVSADGKFVFGFGRDDKKNHQLTVELNGKMVTHNLTPQKRSYKIQRINGIPKKIMQPSAEAQARIKQDNSQVKAARNVSSNLVGFSQKFIAPAQGEITGVYGSQRVFNGEPKWPHFGVDYAGKIGAPVVAPADGIVTLFVPDMFYSGGTLIIDHGHGISSSFLHLSKSYVKVGDKVTQGQKVAAIGNSGRVTGPHLDWRVNWQQVRLDPQLVLQAN